MATAVVYPLAGERPTRAYASGWADQRKASMMIIARRFNGPADSGNGGYSSGLVARHVEARAVAVTLRVPPPLETELTVRPGPTVRPEPTGTADSAGTSGQAARSTSKPSASGVAVYDGDTLVATGHPAAVDDVVPAVGFEQAEQASAHYPGFRAHPFPTCYVCGPARDDGLGLAPGRLRDGHTATPWVVPTDVTPATVWAALDCPGGWTVGVEARPYVLGRMTARVDRVPTPGQRCVVTGALLGEEGRKAYVATTLWIAGGEGPLATARATWIALLR